MKADDLRSYLLLATIGTISQLQLLALPGFVDVLVKDAGMSASFAGWSASVNFLGGALVAIVIALRSHRVHLRFVATVGLGLAVATDIISGYTPEWAGAFLVARFFAGVGTGIAYAAALAAFARLKDAERGYALFVMMQFAVSGIVLYLLPVYSGELSVRAMFLVLAALNFAALLLCRSLPGRAVMDHLTAGYGSELRVLTGFTVIGALLGFCLFQMANTVDLTYVELRGGALGFSDEAVGTALMLSALAGIPSAFTIVLIGERFGRVRPVLLGIGTAIVGLLILIFTDGFPMYFFGVVLLGMSWAFCLPFLQGFLAALDPGGSVLVAGSVMTAIGNAAGPALAALIVVGGRYGIVFSASIVLFAFAAFCFVVASRRAVTPNATGQTS